MSPPSQSAPRMPGETWKLNARDRSVIIQDKGEKPGEMGGGGGGQSPAIGLGFAKKAPSRLSNDDVAGELTIDRDQSRIQILSVCVWLLL